MNCRRQLGEETRVGNIRLRLLILMAETIYFKKNRVIEPIPIRIQNSTDCLDTWRHMLAPVFGVLSGWLQAGHKDETVVIFSTVLSQ